MAPRALVPRPGSLLTRRQKGNQTMSLAMSKEQLETFLAATRIGIVSVEEAGRGPCSVPVWYQYEPGGVLRFASGRESRKAKLVAKASRISFCVQTEAPPYSYVSVEGPVSIEPIDYERHVKEMAIRYLGDEIGLGYLQMTHPDESVADTILVALTPKRWWSVDYNNL